MEIIPVRIIINTTLMKMMEYWFLALVTPKPFDDISLDKMRQARKTTQFDYNNNLIDFKSKASL